VVIAAGRVEYAALNAHIGRSRQVNRGGYCTDAKSGVG